MVSSLAGRVREPLLPAGTVREGGFGGVEGMRSWLNAHSPAIVVDATHPFAVQVSGHAAEAARLAASPHLRLQRPPWTPRAGERWLPVPDHAAAADLLPAVGARPLLTIGRQQLAAFTEHPACRLLDLLVRCVQAPTIPLPARTTVLLARGPFTLAGERALLRENGIDVLVTKNSGGADTSPKLAAARQLSVPVVMIERPPDPTSVDAVTTVDAAEHWVLARLSSRHASPPHRSMRMG